jgi:hypothetical protein
VRQETQGNPQIEQASSLFNQTFGRTLKVQSHIWAFQIYMVHGISGALETTFGQNEQIAKQIVMNPNYGTDEQRRPLLDSLDRCVREATLDTVKKAHAAAEASCIVFVHSMLDAAVLDYCKVSAMMNAEDWKPWAEKEEFTLQQLGESGPDGLLAKAIEGFMKKLNNRSLPNKIETLLNVCKPGSVEVRMNYQFDGARIRRLDDLRNAIVHNNAFGSRIKTVADDLEYLWETNLYLSQLITNRYGLLLGPQALDHVNNTQ